MPLIVEYLRRRNDVYFLTCNGQEVRYDASHADTRITFNWRSAKENQEVYVISPFATEVVKWSARYTDDTGRTFYPYPSEEEMTRINAVNDLIVSKFKNN